MLHHESGCAAGFARQPVGGTIESFSCFYRARRVRKTCLAVILRGGRGVSNSQRGSTGGGSRRQHLMSARNRACALPPIRPCGKEWGKSCMFVGPSGVDSAGRASKLHSFVGRRLAISERLRCPAMHFTVAGHH